MEKIKKLLSIFLFFILVLNFLPAFSTDCIDKDLNKNIQQKTSFSYNSQDEISKFIKITKEKVPLESKLKDKYKAYSYKIVNNSNETITLLNIYNNCRVDNAVIDIQKEQTLQKFPRSLLYFAKAPAVALEGLVSLAIPPVFLLENAENAENTKALLFAFAYPIYMPIVYIADGIWYSLTTPFQIKAKKEIETKLKTEGFNLDKNSFKSIDLNPQEEFKFTLLIYKKIVEDKIIFYFGQKNSSQIHVIIK